MFTSAVDRAIVVRSYLVALLIGAGLGCRGETQAEQAARSDSALIARTWGLAYLQQSQLPLAETQFRVVVRLAPREPLGYADLGLVFLREGRYSDAEAQLRRAASLDSTSSDVDLMLAEVYRRTGRDAAARAAIDQALRADSTDIRALYAIGDLHRVLAHAPANIVARLDLTSQLLSRSRSDSAAGELEALQRQLPRLDPAAARAFTAALQAARAGRATESAAQLARFRQAMEVTAAYQVNLEQLGAASPSGPPLGYPVLAFNPNLGDRGRGKGEGDARGVAGAIRFVDATAGSGLEGITPLPDSVVGGGALERSVALAVGDYDDDDTTDLFVAGHLYRGSNGRFIESTAQAGITLSDRAVSAAFGDDDNDGHVDLFVLTTGSTDLFANEGRGRFRGVSPSPFHLQPSPVSRSLFVDLDHDGDLDLLLASSTGTRVYRNNLDGTFVEMAAAMGLAGPSRDAAVADLGNDGKTDVVLVTADGHLRLLHNAGQGHFTDVTATSGLTGVVHAGAVTVGDYDNDGALDLFVTSLDGSAPALFHNRGDGTFEVDPRSAALRRVLRGSPGIDAEFFDFDNDGRLDLIVVGKPATPAGRGVYLFRNDATRGFEDVSSILPDGLGGGRAVAAADFDHDGDLDLIVVGWDGRPHLLRNDGGNVNQYVDVRLVALRQGSGKNNALGRGAALELRAGDLYQYRLMTDGVTHFGLGRQVKADVLRVRWTNGVSQTVYYPGTQADVLEQQQLKGSCPFLYVWNGSRFTFATDVMWNSALGMPLDIMASGTITASSRASEEYLRIPSGMLHASANGRYELRLSEELWELAYLDRLRMLAVDHPDSVQVFLNERFQPAGPSALRLYQVTKARPPVSATDEQGNDLLPALRSLDDVYAATLQPTRYQGVTELHDVVLDFGHTVEGDSLFLFLTGWIYPTDASINLSLAQSHSMPIVPPQLQVKDRAGAWQTVIPDIGFPAGKNKTVIVDLTGKFLSADHHIRIRTTMGINWDRAFIATTAAARPPSLPALTTTTLLPIAADLHYRGFSRMYRKGGRYGPQWYDYGDVTRAPAWAPIPGAFTRYGDVLPLLRDADDMYVIFGPGDEIALQFDAAAAPPVPIGWTRDFIFASVAWMKDADLNTAAGSSVEPLPFAGMTRYPYGGEQRYPEDSAHERYRRSYNTRIVR